MRNCLRYVLTLGLVASGLGVFSIMNATDAQASGVRAVIDLSQQRMSVFVNGKQKYRWPVSTGTRKWPTRTGSFTPFAMERSHYSKKWRMKLTHVVKFDHNDKGINAIHGTSMTSRLGRPASHGCVRLSPRNAAIFYKLVGKAGLWGTQVVVKN